MRPWQLGPHGKPSRVSLQPLLPCWGSAVPSSLPSVTAARPPASSFPKLAVPMQREDCQAWLRFPHLCYTSPDSSVPIASPARPTKGEDSPRCGVPRVVGSSPCPPHGDPGSLSRGRGEAALRAVSCAGCVGTRAQRRLFSRKVVPRQPHPRPSRAHADEGAAGRSLPGAQEERAQLLRHLLSVRPGRSEAGRGAGLGARGGGRSGGGAVPVLSFSRAVPAGCLTLLQRGGSPCHSAAGTLLMERFWPHVSPSGALVSPGWPV